MGTATLYKTDGTVIPLDHRPTLEEAQRTVGGWIELIKARDQNGKIVTLVVDEEGKLKNRPVNMTITDTYGQSIYKGYIVGDVIVLAGWRTVGG